MAAGPEQVKVTFDPDLLPPERGSSSGSVSESEASVPSGHRAAGRPRQKRPRPWPLTPRWHRPKPVPQPLKGQRQAVPVRICSPRPTASPPSSEACSAGS